MNIINPHDLRLDADFCENFKKKSSASREARINDPQLIIA